MARKAIVDRDTVLQLLREGKTSQSIASQFGVSRQAIDLYRKEFVHTGVLEARTIYHATPPPTRTTVPSTQATKLSLPAKPPQNISLDQMIDLLIRSFDALKRVPELEAECEKLRQSYADAIQQVEELKQTAQKRQEQEARWLNAQQP